METASLYSEARNEYLKQMATWIVPPLVEFFRKEYNTLSDTEGKKVMSAFQTYCSEVPRWNQDVIDANINIILDNCRCDYMEELMTAVFIAYTKMLTAIRVNSRQKKLQITLPKLDHFLHRVFIECARSFWKAPYLFAQELSPIEKQKNILQAEQICTDALSGAVRSLLPVKSILRDYLDDGEDEEEKEEKEEKDDKEDEKDEEKEKEDEVEEKMEEIAEVKDDVKDVKIIGGGATETKPAPVPVGEAAPVPPAPAPVGDAAPAPVGNAAPAPVGDAAPTPVLSKTEPVILPSGPVPVITPIIVEEVKAEPMVIEKLSTSPVPPTITPSDHQVSDVVLQPPVVAVSKSDHVAPSDSAPNMVIDTEPSVHFASYDTLYDETTNDISHIRYSPKNADMDDSPYDYADEKPPRLSFGAAATSIDSDDLEDLEPVVQRIATPSEDIDAPLNGTDDFEVLG